MSNHKCNYYQSYKGEYKGNVWTETLLNRWEVHGAFLPVSYHRSEKAALVECERREKLPPYTPPKGKRTGK